MQSGGYYIEYDTKYAWWGFPITYDNGQSHDSETYNILKTTTGAYIIKYRYNDTDYNYVDPQYVVDQKMQDIFYSPNEYTPSQWFGYQLFKLDLEAIYNDGLVLMVGQASTSNGPDDEAFMQNDATVTKLEGNRDPNCYVSMKGLMDYINPLFATKDHKHTREDITDFDHTHNIEDITGVTTSIDTPITLKSTGDQLAQVDFYNNSINQVSIISLINKPSSSYYIEYGSSWIKCIANSSGSIVVSQNDSNFTTRSTTPLIRFTCNFNMNKLNLITIEYNGQKQSVSAGYTVDPYKNNVLTLGALLNVLYPVGSIYTSMNNISPSQIFGGTWTQITDRFMYCSSGESKQTGGSKKISVAQLPAHNHRIYCTANANTGGTGVRQTWDHDGRGYSSFDTGINTGNTGSGDDYLPPYITIFAWYRTA